MLITFQYFLLTERVRKWQRVIFIFSHLDFGHLIVITYETIESINSNAWYGQIKTDILLFRF